MAFAKPRESPKERRERRERERAEALAKRQAEEKEALEQRKKANPLKTKDGRKLHDWELWEAKASNHVEVSFINSGFCTVPESFLMEGKGDVKEVQVPVLCCMLRHPVHGLIMVDLGLPDGTTGGMSTASMSVRKAVVAFKARLHKKGSAATQIANSNVVKLEDVNTVIYTHYHYDHTGDVERYPNAQIVVGEGTMRIVNSFMGKRAHGITKEGFPTDHERIQEVKFTDELCVGAFRHTYDLFGDASVVLLDCFGHTHGNMSVLVRTKNQGQILLAGDTVYCLGNYDHGKTCPKGIMPKLWSWMPMWARRFWRPDEVINQANECVRKMAMFHQEHPQIIIIPAHDHDVYRMLEEREWMFPNFIQ